MPKIIIPPTPHGNCAGCKHFIPDEVKRYHVTPNGMIQVPHDFPVTHPKDTWADVGPCTFFPLWQTCPTNHWCAQFSSRVLSS